MAGIVGRALVDLREEAARAGGRTPARAALTAGQVDAHVGRRMRSRREALGLSQGRLARQLGLTFSQVQKYEKGSNRIGAGRLYLIASLLEVTVEYFFEGLDEAPANVPNGRAAMPGPEAEMLHEAFQSISDADTRRAVLSLVFSITESAEAARRPLRAAD